MKTQNHYSRFVSADAPIRFLSVLFACVAIGAVFPSVAVTTLHAQPADSSSNVIVKGWVEGPDRIQGARVRLIDEAGNVLGMSAPTGERGTFFVRVRSNLPAHFYAEARGGSLGETVLLATLEGFDSTKDTLFIDPATTMVARLLKDHPSLSHEQADHRVEDFLGVPEYDNIERIPMDESNPDSNAAKIKADETQDGNMGHFIDRMEVQMESSNDAVLPPPLGPMAQALGAPTLLLQEVDVATGVATYTTMIQGAAANPFPVRPQVPGISMAIPSFISNIGFSLLSNALSKVGEVLIGWMFNSLGWTTDNTVEILKQVQQIQTQLDGMSKQLGQISGGITALSQQMTVFQRDIKQTVLMSEYNTRVGQLRSIVSTIKTCQENTQWIADESEALPKMKPADRATSIEGIRYVQDETRDYIRLKLVPDFSLFHDALCGTGASETPLLILWSNVVKAGNVLWTQASTRQVVAQYDYFDLLQLAQFNLILEYYHTIKLPPSRINKLTDDYKKFRADEMAMVIFKAPSPLEAIDTRTNLVWCTGLVVATDLRLTHLDINPGAPNGAKEFLAPTVTYGKTTGMVMRLPTKAEFDALTTGWSGTSVLAWLRAQSGGPAVISLGDFLKETGNLTTYEYYAKPLIDSSLPADKEKLVKLLKDYVSKDMGLATRARWSITPNYSEGTVQIDRWPARASDLWWTSTFETSGNVPRRTDTYSYVYIYRLDLAKGAVVKDELGHAEARDVSYTTDGRSYVRYPTAGTEKQWITPRGFNGYNDWTKVKAITEPYIKLENDATFDGQVIYVASLNKDLKFFH